MKDSNTKNELMQILILSAEEDYKCFIQRILEDDFPYALLGVRYPALKKIARNMNDEQKQKILQMDTFDCHEMLLLRIFVLNDIKSFEKWMPLFLNTTQFMQSWMHTDAISLRVQKKDPSYSKEKIQLLFQILSQSSLVYQRRMAALLVKNCFLDEDGKQILFYMQQIQENHHAIEMAKGWTLSEWILNHPDSADEILASKRLSCSVQKITIQKCLDSKRLNAKQKEQIRAFRIK